MSHTPWTKEQSEKWADEYCERYGYFPHGNVWHGIVDAFTKAAEMIEACPTMYGNVGAYGSTFSTYPPGTFIQENNTHSAKLVGVREIADSDERGSGR